ncbi:Endocuticle structural glycoprotein SgAbd-8 [Frankliniella fusca]|uniref:Endocuticle structural glycoprotein SgAbd-8 n=1 Tax=Frankliniella fusca TaxID=407009 RepID=A0AAE1HSS3_9NEOP|nr:Endocuticle structural glycoprotein SgAbd-8 [Frankliniella fusca]
MNASIVLAVLALAALAAARPQQFQQQPQQFQQFQPQSQQFQTQPQQFRQAVTPVPIISRQETRDEHGQYSLAFSSADGIVATDSGALKEIKEGENKGDYFLARKGSYRYLSPEGEIVELHYIADENGFQVVNQTPVRQ